MKSKVAYFLVFLVILCACGQEENKAPLLFQEWNAEQTGILFSNDLAESEDFNIIEYLYYYNGGGIAVGDINNDGLPDLYFTANEGENKLYLNEGGLKFRDITANAGVVSSGMWKTGTSMVDVNGDGWLDIYQTRVSQYKGLEGHNELYINNGDLTFSEKSAEWGINFQGFSTHSGFFDMDNDGDLDLYLLNHAVHTQNSFGNTTLRLRKDSVSGDRIYENEGDGFIDVTERTGIYSSAIGYGLGLGFTDFDRDGYTDIYVSNDFSENDYLYHNNGDGTFTEQLEDMANRTSRFSMGNDLADLNNDGLVDIMTLDMMPEDEIVRKRSAGDDSYEVLQVRRRLGYMEQFGRNTVLMNMGRERFMDVALMSGLYATDWSWSTLMADFDQDGRKDIFISNGIWKRPNDLDFIDFTASNLAKDPNLSDAAFTSRMPSGKVSNYFYRNVQDWQFQDVSETWADLEPGVTNGATYADLDGDGDLDLILNHLNEPGAILKNMSREAGSHYLAIDFIASETSTHTMGVAVQCWIEGKAQYVEHYANRGFQSSTQGPVIIGLKDSTIIDSLVITFQGRKMVKYRVAPNQKIRLDLNELGDEIPLKSNEAIYRRLSEEAILEFTHEENTLWEFTREPLMPHMNSYEGPALAVADFDGDGAEDLFIGGAKHQPSGLFTQKSGGLFEVASDLGAEATWEDVDASFFDMDDDGDLDLFVVSGGNEFVGESSYRKPRVYRQEAGAWQYDTTALPLIYHTGSTVAVHDFNKDGFPDIFLGSLATPWNYGVTPKSYLLTNQGGQSFAAIEGQVPGLEEVGMVKEAQWVDLDGNGEKDLVVAALWQPLKVFYVHEGALKGAEIISEEKGWWQTLLPIDFDQDGDMDLALGNLGLNTKLKASKKEPVRLYIKDIDGNKRIDHVLTYYREGEESPFANKKDLIKPLSYINRRFRDFKGYAEAPLREIFNDQELAGATVLEADEFRSGVLINEKGKFAFRPFSPEAQTSMVRSIEWADFDTDGQNELFLSGNFSQSTLQDAPYTEGFGVMYEIANGELTFVPNSTHGIYLDGDVVATRLLTIKDRSTLLVVKNNAPLEWWVRD